jgi:hypothetical protein
MSKAQRWRGILILGALAVFAGPAIAQDVVDEPRYAPSLTGESGGWDLLSGKTVPQGQWSFGLYYNNVDRVFEFNDEADADWHSLRVSLGYGLSESFELSLMLPYDDIDADIPGGGDPLGSGLGNARLGAKWRVTGTPDSDTSLAINAFAELPTGDEDVLAGDTGFGLGLNWSLRNWLINVGYRAPGDVDDFEISDEIKAGIGYISAVSDRLDWITEVAATIPTDSDEAVFEENVDFTTGGRLWFGEGNNWAFNFALRTDLLQLADTDDHCPLGGLLGLTFMPGRFIAPPPPPPPPPVERYTLRVDKRGNCEGLVTSTPVGIDCGADCSETYDAGTQVTLRARGSAADCEFEGWSGDADCSDGAVTMDRDLTCIATFNREVVPPAPPPPREERVTVQFNSGSARLSNIAKAKLDEVALRMRQDPELSALVIGYSDSQGPEATNQRMSEQRAQAVEDYLVQRQGIDADRISVQGRGSADPVASNETAEGRAQNRRAVVILRIE